MTAGFQPATVLRLASIYCVEAQCRLEAGGPRSFVTQDTTHVRTPLTWQDRRCPSGANALHRLSKGAAMSQTVLKTDETANDIPIEAWDTVLFDKFVQFRKIMTRGLSDHSDNFFRNRTYKPGERVLDVGCGFGDTTQQIAKQVGPNGAALGMDCSTNFIDECLKDAKKAGSPATFFVADAQADDLRGPYDHVFARFGTMFFNLPGAAFRNIRKSLRPGGTFSMIVWRKREDNAWVHEAELVAREIVPVVEHSETDQVHCGPGPFSMAGPDMVSAMLKAAGFERVTFERYDTKIGIGDSVDEAVEFAMSLGPAGEIIRLAGDEGARLKPQVVAALKKVLAPHTRADGSVWCDSSSWVVTARNPG